MSRSANGQESGQKRGRNRENTADGRTDADAEGTTVAVAGAAAHRNKFQHLTRRLEPPRSIRVIVSE